MMECGWFEWYEVRPSFVMSRLVIYRLRSRMPVSSKFEIYVMHLAILRGYVLYGASVSSAGWRDTSLVIAHRGLATMPGMMW